jgi:hypothetical protein
MEVEGDGGGGTVAPPVTSKPRGGIENFYWALYMSMIVHFLQKLALVIATILAAYISVMSGVGILFGGLGELLLMVVLFVPALAFPCTLLCWWKPTVGWISWTLLMFLLFGGLVAVDASHPMAIVLGGTYLLVSFAWLARLPGHARIHLPLGD